jgi:hypothetical protein
MITRPPLHHARLLVALLLTLCVGHAGGQLPDVATPADAPIRYPDNAGLLNVRDFGAVGDGEHDDTAAIQAAISQTIDSNRRYFAPRIVYLPSGTYRLTAPLWTRREGGQGNWSSGMLLMGESRESVVLRLDDAAEGFDDPEQPQGLIVTGSENPMGRTGGGNQAFRHSLLHLTVDTGARNPGAAGVQYLANNLGVIEDVTIRSGDPRHIGVAGLLMHRYGPGPALIKHVRIEGFDHAVSTRNREYGMTFEHLTLRHQRVGGFRNHNNALWIRGLNYEGRGPAVLSEGDAAQLVLVDSRLASDQGDAAVVIRGGIGLVRDVQVRGYRLAVEHPAGAGGFGGDLPAAAGRPVDEWLSAPPLMLADAPPRTLNLPIRETPTFHTNDVNRWADVTDFGATLGGEDDDGPGIQAAIDSGAEVILLPSGTYRIGEPVIVRGNVRKITGAVSAILQMPGEDEQQLFFVIDDAAEEGVIFEFLRMRGRLEHRSARPLVLRHSQHNGLANTAAGTGPIFLENVIGRPYRFHHPVDVWGRQVNPETTTDPLIEIAGGNVWMLGVKIEGSVGLAAIHGGSFEVLGGLFYPAHRVDEDTPLIRHHGGRFSISYVTSAYDWNENYDVQLRQTLGGQTRDLRRGDVPGRGVGESVVLLVGDNQ